VPCDNALSILPGTVIGPSMRTEPAMIHEPGSTSPEGKLLMKRGKMPPDGRSG
jgi:hypothetical protein